MAYIKGAEFVIESKGALQTHIHKSLLAQSQNLKVVGPGGDYSDINSAFAAGEQALYLRNGTHTLTADYVVDPDQPFILMGEDMRKTIFKFSDYRILFEVCDKFRPGGLTTYNSTAGSNIITVTTSGWDYTTEGIQIGDFIQLSGEPSLWWFRVTGFPASNQIQLDRNVVSSATNQYFKWSRHRFSCNVDTTSGTDIVTLNAPSNLNFQTWGVKAGWIIELDRWYEIIDVGSNWLQISIPYMGPTQTYNNVDIEVAHKNLILKNLTMQCKIDDSFFVGYGSGLINPVLKKLYVELDPNGSSAYELNWSEDGINGYMNECYFVGIHVYIPPLSKLENSYFRFPTFNVPSQGGQYFYCVFDSNPAGNNVFYSYMYNNIKCKFTSCTFLNVGDEFLRMKYSPLLENCIGYAGTTKFNVSNNNGKIVRYISSPGSYWIETQATVYCDTTSGSMTVYLAEQQVEEGFKIRIVDWGNYAATNPITVNPASSTINGQTGSETLSTNGTVVEYEFDGVSNWRKIVLK